MCVHEVDAACGAPGGTAEGREEQWEREHEPALPPEVADDAVPVRDPEVRERGRRDDVDLDPGVPQMLDRVANEHTGDVPRRAWIRGRENENLHGRTVARPNTTGSATASTAKT